MDFLHDFMIRSLVAGALLAPSLAVMGCFLMWRRMVFLSDTLSHAAILGVALGMMFQVSPYGAVLVIALGVAFILSLRNQSHFLPLEIWMSILSYGSLASGLILFVMNRQNRVDPDAILFGDILGVSSDDLFWLMAVGFFVGIVAWRNWRQWLMVTLDEDLAKTSGVHVPYQRFLMIGMVALVIAVGMKIIGALLLPALLILPAATVSRWSKSPEQMVLLSVMYLLITYGSGFYTSFYLDTPTGPTIVLSGLVLFLGGTLFGRSLQARK